MDSSSSSTPPGGSQCRVSRPLTSDARPSSVITPATLTECSPVAVFIALIHPVLPGRVELAILCAPDEALPLLFVECQHEASPVILGVSDADLSSVQRDL